MLQPGRERSRLPAMRTASGRPPQQSSTRPTAAGSAAALAGPTIAVNSARASAGASTSRSSSSAPARPGVPSWLLREVTMTPLPAVPGSSGRTWAASRASSSTTSIRRPAISVR